MSVDGSYDEGLEPLPPQPIQAPQTSIDNFWSAFTTKFPGKIHQILPTNPYAASKSASEAKGPTTGQPAHQSYHEAREACIKAVDKIAKECRRCNLRYRDPHFDIEFDLKTKKYECLTGLYCPPDRDPTDGPRAVKRVEQIFDKPQFYIDGPSAVDIRQGSVGDCWFLAALGALGNKPELIRDICVHRDEKVGVYGFVFHRDGEWIRTVIDDKLYLKHADFHESRHEMPEFEKVRNRNEPEEEYRKVYQAGSRALYFAQCTTENETWLPLLEKAYAKAHGDYASIDGGFTGEAIEDLTGGVTTELFTSDILDLDIFWKEELLRVNKDFLFGCATGKFDNWLGRGKAPDRKGIESSHAYSVMETREIQGFRLLKLRNPWGEVEYSGPWSDGSKEWTPERMELLKHTFGNDGVFWIQYEDWVKKYHFLDRTRLFDEDWEIAKQWTSIQVPWATDYNGTKFTFTLSQASSIVVVLSQLDDRYWVQFKGQYTFSLHFRINRAGEDDYIVRSHGNYMMKRSVSTELELEPGTYDVRMKITAVRNRRNLTIPDVIKDKIGEQQQGPTPQAQDKLLQVALSYDMAHAKGIVLETEEEKLRRAKKKAKEEANAREANRKKAKELKYKDWLIEKKYIERDRRRRQREQAHRDRKAPLESEWTGVDEETAYEPQYEDPRQEKQQRCQGKGKRPHHRSKQREGDADYVNEREGPRPPHRRALHIDELDGLRTNYQDDQDEYEDRRRPQERIDSFNSDPAFFNGPTSEGFAQPPSDTETIYSYNSSVDSDLDEEKGWFPPKALPDEDEPPIEGSPGDVNADLEEFSSDPWNAVCVVGLRVFTKCGKATIRVVRPDDEVPMEESMDNLAASSYSGQIAPLDIDDQMRGMSEDTVTPVSAGAERKISSHLPTRLKKEDSEKERKGEFPKSILKNPYKPAKEKRRH